MSLFCSTSMGLPGRRCFRFLLIYEKKIPSLSLSGKYSGGCPDLLGGPYTDLPYDDCS